MNCFEQNTASVSAMLEHCAGFSPSQALDAANFGGLPSAAGSAIGLVNGTASERAATAVGLLGGTASQQAATSAFMSMGSGLLGLFGGGGPDAKEMALQREQELVGEIAAAKGAASRSARYAAAQSEAKRAALYQRLAGVVDGAGTSGLSYKAKAAVATARLEAAQARAAAMRLRAQAANSEDAARAWLRQAGVPPTVDTTEPGLVLFQKYPTAESTPHWDNLNSARKIELRRIYSRWRGLRRRTLYQAQQDRREYGAQKLKEQFDEVYADDSHFGFNEYTDPETLMWGWKEGLLPELDNPFKDEAGGLFQPDHITKEAMEPLLREERDLRIQRFKDAKARIQRQREDARAARIQRQREQSRPEGSEP
jgi:hypothetical protein